MNLRLLGSSFSLTLLLSFALVLGFTSADEQVLPGPLTRLTGHKEAVYGICFSADGKQVLTASGDATAKVWEVSSTKEFKTYAGANGHKGLILSVALSPDGTQFATGSADNSVRVWDYPSSQPLQQLALSAQGRIVIVSPDGSKLAVADQTGKISIWQTTSAKLLQTCAGHQGAVTALAFAPNGAFLASVGTDSTLRYWNVNDGKLLASFAAHPGEITGVTFSSAGNAVYTSGKDGTVRAWSFPPPTPRLLQAPLQEPITAMAVSPDGAQVVAAYAKTIRLSVLSTGQTLRDFTGVNDPITALAVTNGGSLVAAGTSAGRVVLWQSKDGQLLMNQSVHRAPITGLAFSPAGNQLVTVSKDGLCRLFAAPPVPERIVPHPETVHVAVLSPDGKRLATGGKDKTIRLYKLDNLKVLERQLSGHSGAIHSISYNEDGKYIVSAGDDALLRFWNVEKGEQFRRVGAHTDAVTSVRWLPGNRILSTSKDGSVKLWQLPDASGEKLGFAHAGVVSCQALSPDGTRLLTGCHDKQVRAWNLSTGQLERTWTGPTLGVLSVAYSPKGDLVAAGSADRSIFIWEAASNKVIQKVTGLPEAVHALAFTPDGKLVVSGLGDGTLRLLEVTSGKEVRSLEGHKGPIHALVLTGKGDQVFTGGADGNVLLRNLTGGAPVQTWKHGAAIQALALRRDGARLAVGGASKQVQLFECSTGKVESTIVTPSEVLGISFHPEGKKLAIAGRDQHARIFSSDGVLQEFFTHDGAVNGVLFSSDGKHLYTIGADKSARSWSPTLLWQARHEGPVFQAIVLPGRGRILSAGGEGLLRLWNLTDGQPVGSIRAHTGAIRAVGASADEKRLVSVGMDKVARVWDLSSLPGGKMAGATLDQPQLSLDLSAVPLSLTVSAKADRAAVGVEVKDKEQVRVLDLITGKEVLTLGEGESMPGHSLTFLSDERTLVAAGRDKTARLVDLNVLRTFEAHPGGCAGVAFHENGTQLLTGGADRTVKLWNLATGKQERTWGPLDSAVDALALARGSTQIAATADKTLKVWNFADGKEVLSLTMPTRTRGVSFTADRTRIATAGEDGRLRVWDLALKLEQQAFLHQAAVTGVVCSPSTATQLVSASLDKTLAVHTLSNTGVVLTGSAVHAIALSANTGLLLGAGEDGKVRWVNLATAKIERTYETGAKSSLGLSIARSGNLLAVRGSDRTVQILSLNEGKRLTTLSTTAVPTSLAFSANSQALVVGAKDGSITAFDVTFNPGQPLPPSFGKQLQRYQHASDATNVAFPSTGIVFYSVAADNKLQAWKLASETPLRTFSQPNTVNAVAFHKEGKILVTGSGDGKIRLYDLTKGTLLREINAHPQPNNEGAIYALALTPDGSGVVSASKDQTLKLFQLSDGKPLREFRAFKDKEFPKGHQEAVLAVAISPDGKLLASGGADRSIKIWNFADGSVLHELTNPALKAPAPGEPALAHPGWVYALRFLDHGTRLVAAGAAPRLKGYLSMWDSGSGKRLWGQEVNIGSIYALAVSPDETLFALGTGGSLRMADSDLHSGWILKRPK